MLNRIVTLIAALLVCIVPAKACSLSEGTFIQSNFEMIDASGAIVVAKAVRKEPGQYGDKIYFEVTKVLKGMPGTIVVDRSGHFGKPTPSDPDDISSANPEAFMGPCNRGTYRRGDSYVLMLWHNEKDGFAVAGDVFSRINEDDFGPNSLWRKTIETYLAIQKNPDRMAQLAEMQELVRRGERETATTVEKKIGEDALRHLLTIHPDKPTQWLMGIYADPNFVFRDLKDVIVGTEEEQVDDFISLVYEGPQAESLKSVVLRALSEGDHRDAEPLFRDVIAQATPDPTELGTSVAFFIKRGDYHLVKRAFGEHILWVEGVTGPGAGPGFWSSIWPAIGYGDNKTVTAEFADWWERQGIARCLLKNGPTDCRYDSDKAEALLDNPIKNEKLLIAAASSDAVEQWADAEIDRLKNDGVSPRDKQWRLPVKLLLAAYRREKPMRVLDLACGSKEERERIAITIGYIRSYRTKNLLYEMMAMEQHEHVRGELFTSAVKFVDDTDLFSQPRPVGRAYEYARSDGVLPLRKRDNKYLPCH